MQGTTDVAFTVLDVLGYLDEIPVCTGYEIDGKVTTEFPTTGLLEKAKPVLEVLPGWKTDIRGIKKYEESSGELPQIYRIRRKTDRLPDHNDLQWTWKKRYHLQKQIINYKIITRRSYLRRIS